MQKIFFHSYKGGCGRSYIMANVAVELASQKDTKVGVVDLDYDAPGMAHFMSKVNPISLEPNTVDLIFLMTKNSPAHLDKAIIDIKDNISLLPINSLQPGTLMDEFITLSLDKHGEFNNRLERILNSFADQRQLDYILIDLRPGTSFLVYTLATLFDKAIQIFKINKQDIYGTKLLNRVLSGRGPNVNVLIPTLVPMTVENYEVKLSKIIRDEFADNDNKPDERYFAPVIDELFFDDGLLMDNSTIVDKTSPQCLKMNNTIKYIARRIQNG